MTAHLIGYLIGWLVLVILLILVLLAIRLHRMVEHTMAAGVRLDAELRLARSYYLVCAVVAGGLITVLGCVISLTVTWVDAATIVCVLYLAWTHIAHAIRPLTVWLDAHPETETVGR